MDSIYDALMDRYSDKYEIQKSFILTEDGFPNLVGMNKFLIKEVQNTNKIPYFGRLIFPFIALLGGHKVMRFFHRQMAHKSFKQGLEALRLRKPNIIISNHYFTDLLAVEYKRRIDPDVVVINYNPDPTLHTFWDRRDGIFVVDNPLAYKKAVKYKFKQENLRLVTPCVRKCIESNTLSREQLRDKFDLPQDKFTVVIADGGYMLGRGPKFAKYLIKKGLPITLCVIAGNNKKKYDYFKAIERGEGKLKVPEAMTFRAYEFLDNAYELYGAADVFLTKGGPNAVLDSIYMRTPVMINYCPHVMEAGTVKVFINAQGCGETVFRKRKAAKRIRAFMDDKSALAQYVENIENLIAEGNGISAVADIVEEEAQKQRLVYEARGIVIGSDSDDDGGGAIAADDVDINIKAEAENAHAEDDVLR
ncbi:MAG: hypothetical protein J1F69_03225 [Clostridiales bacterium]|nr:hypothetical protein [Clostridiales bacterium]